MSGRGAGRGAMRRIRCPVAVLGAGSWGTSLALLLARNGSEVRLWARDPEHVEAIERARCNHRHLPGHALPESLRVTASLDGAVAGGARLLMAVPSDGFGGLLRRTAGLVAPEASIVCAAKGLDPASGRLLHELARELAPRASFALLSGPTFAAEVAAGLPAAATIASHDPRYAKELAGLFHSARFRVYTSGDVVGVGIGGAVKNVLAIAAGIADGLGFGANARAALITRGLAELWRLGSALGGRRETLMGLAGLGDLVLTCTGEQSRNRRFGLLLAAGHGAEEARTLIGQAVEGVRTAALAQRLAARHDVEMPIVAAVDRVLNRGSSPAAAVEALLSRRPRLEE